MSRLVLLSTTIRMVGRAAVRSTRRSARPGTILREQPVFASGVLHVRSLHGATDDKANKEVLAKLSAIIDPDLNQDIVSLGFVKGLQCDTEGKVSFTLELTTPACPIKEEFKASAEKLVKELSWVRDVSVTMSSSASPRRPSAKASASGLSKVGTIIAVSSCKGGVGKSTVAVNLAYSLKALGGKVGLFDADIYGPSLPTMVSTGGGLQRVEGKEMILPKEYEGVKLMSYGWAANKSKHGTNIMRGPMVSNVVQQLISFTEWGELDYLILDMPPGTGDIQLTLCQQVAITAAVIVTTPQKLSYVDVVKGMDMFDKLKVPTVALVENMSYFTCGDCSARHYPFGKGFKQRLVEEFGVPSSFVVPIHAEISRGSDTGLPLCASDDSPELKSVYTALARAVVQEVSKVQHGGLKPPLVECQDGQIVVSPVDGMPWSVPARTVRLNCRCAGCVDEYSGQPKLDPKTVSADVHPLSVEPKGNYAVAVTWSDGHDSSIYSYELLDTLRPAMGNF